MLPCSHNENISQSKPIICCEILPHISGAAYKLNVQNELPCSTRGKSYLKAPLHRLCLSVSPSKQGMQGNGVHLRPVCMSSDAQLLAVQLHAAAHSAVEHGGTSAPQTLLTGTPQPTTLHYSFTATLVFIISAARPH